MIGLVKGLATTLGTFLRKPVTVQYPKERMPLSPRFRGVPGLLWDEAAEQPICTGCGLCMRNCPVSAITVTGKENPAFAEGRSKVRRIVDVFTLDLGLCIFCSTCMEVCNFDAIAMTKNFEIAERNSGNLIIDVDKLLELGRADQALRKSTGGNGASAAVSAQPTQA